MCKSMIVVLCALIACAAAKPHVVGAPLAYTAPAAAVVAAAPAPYVTATSSQVIARNYNGIAAAPFVASVAPVAPFTAAAYTAAPVVARYSAPFGYASSRLISSPYTAAYTAVAPLNYASPYASSLQYAAAAPYVL